MKMLQEFRKFAIQGNVMDMVVGVVIGTSFGKIVSSLVTDIIMPPVGVLTGGIDFANLSLTLQEATEEAPAVTLNYGLFINTVIDFIIVAFAIFVVVKQINRFRKKEEAKSADIPEDVLLLREIRDALKK